MLQDIRPLQHILPADASPMVTVSRSPDTVYTGDNITLTCTIVVDPAVNTAVMVTAVWSRLEQTVTASDLTMVSNRTYKSTLTLTSLETTDSGDYTCTATVSPDGTPFVTASNKGAHSVTVTIGRFNKNHCIVTCVLTYSLIQQWHTPSPSLRLIQQLQERYTC